jgi:hypothetical protein
LVHPLVVRHPSRCVSAVKRSAASRAALAPDAPGPQRDLKMLEQFEQSLPTDCGLSRLPLALLGTPSSPRSRQLRDAVRQQRCWATLRRLRWISTAGQRWAFKTPFQLNPYIAAASIIAWSVTMVIVPLPRRLQSSGDCLPNWRTGGTQHDALGARRIYDLELTIIS